MQYGGGYKLWCYLALASILFAFSCKQPESGGKQKPIPTPPPSNEITITVTCDNYLTIKTPNTFKVNKNSIWKDAKESAKEKITKKEDRKIKEWRVGDESGTVLEENTVLQADTTVFAVSVSTKDMVSIILNLAGGEAKTELDDGSDGNKVLKGLPGEKVEVQGLTKKNHTFVGWKPDLPAVFPKTNDETVHIAQWKEGVRAIIKGDERLKISKENYIDLPVNSSKTFGEIKDEVLSKVSLKPEWNPSFYAVYDFKKMDEDGDEITDSTPITGGTIIYVRTNFTKFRYGEKRIIGWYGSGPRGRIIIPKGVTEVVLWHSKITAIDCTGCENLSTLILLGWYSSNLKSANLKGCTSLTKLDLFNADITKLNLSSCEKLEKVDLSGTAIKSIDLSRFTALTSIYFYNCKNLESVDLTTCLKIDALRYSNFYDCPKAEVKLPNSITDVSNDVFGKDESTWCKKVIVPTEEIKTLVKNSGYPENRIEVKQ